MGLAWIYPLAGLVFLACGIRAARNPRHPRRWSGSLFWCLLALLFLVGDRLQAWMAGALVLGLALLAGLGGVKGGDREPGDGEEATREAGRLGNRLFLPALAIPVLTVGLLFAFRWMSARGLNLVNPAEGTLVSLGLACGLALFGALRVTGRGPGEGLGEGARLLDTIGWAAVLPLYLATLGAVFAKAGVGEAVASLLTRYLPLGSPSVAVLAYGLGMATFTVVMGNAFAAFPVMTAAVGLPVLVGTHHANPAAMAAMGMLTGYCGTLLTPMAANFNLVPAALLELGDPHGVIRAQAPTALVLLGLNLLLMRLLIF
ncbi:MAG: DUF979 domain-containing protein [Acidobacteria bacterium]|nr:DUF979 domain-containing protein [Acidobacteriota bacterium]